MADQQTFDLGSYLGEQAKAVVNKVNPDGSAQITLPDGSTKQFDTNSFLKDHGFDPMKMNIQYNSPAQALPDNPIGFMDGINMAASSDKGRMQFLQDKFGKDNVINNDGNFLVNEKGVWKQAQPGFLKGLTQNLIANSPEMLGGIKGAEAGAAIGSLGGPAAPITVPLGTVAGMAIGAGIAHVIKTEGVEKLNMRSGLDAQEAKDMMGHEVVNNLIWGTALGVAGKAGSAALSQVDKEGLAAIARKMLPGTQEADWRTVLRSGEDSAAVKSNIKDMGAYLQNRTKTVGQGVDPMTQRMTGLLDDFMSKAKISAEKNYGQGLDEIKSVTQGEKIVDTQEAVTKLKTSLANLGILGTAADGKLVVDPRSAAKGGNIQQLFDSGGMKALNAILKQGQAFEGEITFDQARSLMKGARSATDSVSLPQGAQISDDVQKIVAAYMQDMSTATKRGLAGKTIIKDGMQRDAAQLFSEINGKYSQYREVYDQWAKESQAGGNIRQQRLFLDKMIGSKGEALEDQFHKLANATDLKWEPTLQRLQQMRAGRELAPKYSEAGGKFSAIAEATFGGPRKWANRTANANIAQEWTQGLMSKIPASSADKATVQSRGVFADWLNSITPDQKLQFISNPAALRQTVMSVENAAGLQQQMSNDLLNKATNQAQGQ